MLKLEVPAGLNISEVWLLAYKKAIIEETDVSFVFNNTTYTTDPEGARRELSKIRFPEYIDQLCENEKADVEQITKLRSKIEEERQFAKKYLGLDIPKRKFANPRTPRTRK